MDSVNKNLDLVAYVSLWIVVTCGGAFMITSLVLFIKQTIQLWKNKTPEAGPVEEPKVERPRNRRKRLQPSQIQCECGAILDPVKSEMKDNMMALKYACETCGRSKEQPVNIEGGS